MGNRDLAIARCAVRHRACVALVRDHRLAADAAGEFNIGGDALHAQAPWLFLSDGEAGEAAMVVLSSYLGHASISITPDRYGHLIEGHAKSNADLLDAYLERADSLRAYRADGGGPMSAADLIVAAFRIGRWLLALLLFIWFLAASPSPTVFLSRGRRWGGMAMFLPPRALGRERAVVVGRGPTRAAPRLRGPRADR